MGALRTITGFTRYGSTDTWQKQVPEIEARIKTLTSDSVAMTEQIIGLSTIPPINTNRWAFDRFYKIIYIDVGIGEDVNNKTIQVETYFNCFGEWGSQTEYNNNEIFQVFTPKINLSLRYVHIPLIILGNPSLTEIKLQLQSVRNDLPTGIVLAESESALSTITGQNKLVTTYFKFDNYGLRASTKYALVLKPTGTLTEINHIAWGKLDYLYNTGIPSDLSEITEGGGRFSIVGIKL
jgi:hypothetical protein